VPPWTLRVARSTTGLVCTTAGQVVGGRFGLVGLDGHFRTFGERTVNGCGEVGRDRPLIGARVFDADRPQDVRTLVNGVGGDDLREVVVTTADAAPRSVPVGDGGVFVAALARYPEDRAVEVRLRWEDGRVASFPLGKGDGIVVDPLGGPAWKSQGYGLSGDRRTCVGFAPAREFGLAVSPNACGVLGGSMRHPRGYFFAIRRLEPGRETSRFGRLWDGRGNWSDQPPRTAVWGAAGSDVERIEIDGAHGGRTRLPVTVMRTFLAVFPPDVDPADLAVRVVRADGRIEERRGDANLVDRPVGRR
jgi:hypothetical protein